jgi:SAM-dependent methyltransferase
MPRQASDHGTVKRARRAVPAGPVKFVRRFLSRRIPGELVELDAGLGRRPRLLRPPVGFVRLGSLARVTPISRIYGFDRGVPVDRYYIEDFLRRHGDTAEYGAGDIRGVVLEIGGSHYSKRFGSPTKCDVHHYEDANSAATSTGDLTQLDSLVPETYDCIVATQTLHVIFDYQSVLRTLHGALKPGGVLLVTAPGITPACRPDRDLWGDYWRFTSQSLRMALQQVFPAEHVSIEAYGNVLSACAFLYGMAAEDLDRAQLQPRDPDYEVLLAARAVK